MKWIKRTWKILTAVLEAVKKFYEANLLSYSASIAFFTIFSFPGVFIIVVLVAGIFFNEEAVRQQLYEQLKDIVGRDSAMEIRTVLANISTMEHTSLATLVGVSTILFGATSVFVSIQDGLNTAWSLRAKPRRFALKFLLNRLLSFAMVLSIGFIMLVSLLVDALLVLFRDFWLRHLPGDAFYLMEGLNKIFSAGAIALLFFMVYRFLPSGKVQLKFLVPGALFSMLLFILGKYLVGIYLANSSTGTAYGAAGSLVVLLIWVFYSSIVLLFGAQLIAIFSRHYGGTIIPDAGTVRVVTTELER